MDAVRSRLQSRLAFSVDDLDGDFLMNPGSRDYLVSNAKKEAAVLIGLVERFEEAHVVLTKRADWLASHSGQVAFPGGKIDAEDTSPEHAALREAHEEVGLEGHHVELIGRMPDYYSGSGFKIAPVIGFINSEAKLEPNPEEVDYLFEVPLQFLMDSDNYNTGSRVFMGKQRHYLEIPYGEHFIWGVTAGMIRVLRDRVFV